ncbi:hypothetical protein JRQ81_004761 [Phrynocephalus forsythii]|uniref:Cytochrome c oxidase assembly factor 3 n=1 Tax=Phrynocephalus forsythii TaxID=171643 RepID=A0A9Q0XGM2_9SAUR|nr:hypothetical protein JRQ81_004761 [Phrynocephalus forsythii]
MSSQGVGGENLPPEPFASGPQQGNRAVRMVPPRTPQEMEAAMRRLRTRNIATGLIIGAFIIGVYSYTFRAISQETFLDELEGKLQLYGPKQHRLQERTEHQMEMHRDKTGLFIFFSQSMAPVEDAAYIHHVPPLKVVVTVCVGKPFAMANM